MMIQRVEHRGDAGFALMAAIGLLVIFALLGTAYVGYMSLEFEDAGMQLHRIRARNLASGGVYATIGEMRKALDDGQEPEAVYAISLATYRREQGGPGAYPQEVNVSVEDESARINLNTASADLLRAAGMDDAAVGRLLEERANNRVLASVDALRTRSVMDAVSYDALNHDLFTVFTGDETSGAVNLNTASAEVLSAVFGISNDEAKTLMTKRPFDDWEDVLQKVGREPVTFNIDVPPFAPRQQPTGVGFTSTTFRVRSTVTMNMPGGNHRPEYAGVEAVVALNDDGYAIRYWRELRGADAREAETPDESAGETAVLGEPAN